MFPKITEVTIMSTYMPKGDITDRQWYVLDAEGRTLGEVAVEAATILRGKHKPTFTPHVDCGDSVIIINASKIVLTGNKLNDKIYYHHTGYVGNMKAVKYGTLMQQKPEFVVEKAVKVILDNAVMVKEEKAPAKKTAAKKTTTKKAAKTEE